MLKIDKSMKEVKNLLDEREKLWRLKQKEILKEKIEKTLKEGKRTEERSMSFLKECKKFGGPFTEVEEFERVLSRYKNDEKTFKKILKQEITFRRLTCPRDALDRKNLYALNKISVEDLKKNLLELIGTKFEPALEIPDEDDVLEAIMKIFGDSQ